LNYCPDLTGSVGWAVRTSLTWTCVSVLLVKKITYEPERRWTEFVLDASKQALGAYWAWALSTQATSCGDYWTSTIVETTLGVFVEYLALVFFTRLFSKASGNPAAFATGEYYDTKERLVPRNFFLQLVLWLLCVTCMKCVTIPVTMSYRQKAEEAVLKAVSWNQHVEVLIVMLLTPCFMHGLQVWITDDFLKKEGSPGLLSEMMRKALGKKRTKAGGGSGSPKKGKKAGGKKAKMPGSPSAEAGSSAAGEYVPPVPPPTPAQLEAGEAVAVERAEPPPPVVPEAVAEHEAAPSHDNDHPAEHHAEEAAPDHDGAVRFRSTPSVVEAPEDMATRGSLAGRPVPVRILSPMGEDVDNLQRFDSNALPWAEDVTPDKLEEYRRDRRGSNASVSDFAKEAPAEVLKQALKPVQEEQAKVDQALPPEAVEQYRAERARLSKQ